MRDGRWKLLMQPDGSRLELYDLRTDRAEAVNLAAREPKRAKRMADQLRAWYAALPVFV
jgi:arylsulfatase A-like enzyme